MQDCIDKLPHLFFYILCCITLSMLELKFLNKLVQVHCQKLGRTKNTLYMDFVVYCVLSVPHIRTTLARALLFGPLLLRFSHE